jgi:hypothetical protein
MAQNLNLPRTSVLEMSMSILLLLHPVGTVRRWRVLHSHLSEETSTNSTMKSERDVRFFFHETLTTKQRENMTVVYIPVRADTGETITAE